MTLDKRPGRTIAWQEPSRTLGFVVAVTAVRVIGVELAGNGRRQSQRRPAPEVLCPIWGRLPLATIRAEL